MNTFQDPEGNLPFLSETDSLNIIAVGDSEHSFPEAYYLLIQTDDDWYRIMLDVGVLFAYPTEAPKNGCHEDDDECILTCISQGERIKETSVSNGILRIDFANGSSIKCTEDEETSLMLIDSHIPIKQSLLCRGEGCSEECAE